MTVTWLDEAIRQFEQPTSPRWKTPGELAKAIDPDTIQTPALDLIDEALVDVEEGRCDRLIISMPPQEGKSTRVTKAGPLWMLTRNPNRRIVIVSYGSDLAETFGREIRQMITANQGQDDTLDLGLRIAPDNGAVSAWQIAGHRGGVRSVGLGGGITGKPADVLFIDDPLANREQAESDKYRQRAKDFWTSTGSTRLRPGAPVILILTRWHEDDMAGWLLGREDAHRWRVINIPAQADHNPEQAETDPLGREPGEFMQSARTNERTGQQRTHSEWEQVKVQAGPRDWNALYQGRPAPVEGALFKRENWRRYDDPLWIVRDDGTRWVPLSEGDQLCQSWDMAFKATDSSDYVVGGVWLRRGVEAYLLHMVRRRMDFTETIAELKAVSALWPQALAKYVEDKANGTAVINMLSRSLPGLIPVEPEGGKIARANAVAPFQQARNVWLPAAKLLPNVEELVEEAAAFPNGTHDDAVDMTTQALNRMLLNPLFLDTEGGDLDDEIDDAELSISPW